MAVPDEVESLIAGAPLSAHLATSVDDRPHVAPVWYGYRDGVVYFQTGGRKLANVRENPRVALSIEESDDGDVAWNVTLLGRADVVDDPDRVAAVEEWLYDAYEDGEDETTDEGTSATDGGDTANADDYEYAMVAVTVGSASWNVYE